MRFLAIVLLAAVCVSGVPEDNLKYKGAQVFRVTPKTFAQVEYLKRLQHSNTYGFWTEPTTVGRPVDIMAYRWYVPTLKQVLENSKMEHIVLSTDIHRTIVKHQALNDMAREKQGKALEWTAFHTYDEINEWIDTLPTLYPSLVTVEDVGASYEGRTMKLVKVSTGGTGKPAIFTDGGIHAREWISPAVVTFIMNELLSNSAAYQDVLDVVDFIFMPSINPDGYAYTWSDDRLWRKTRSPTDSGLGCYGADPNRNFDFHWMESGSSSNACSDTYAGPVPFSEACAQVVRDQLLKYSTEAVAYLSFHSYSQLWMYPWGYAAELTSDSAELDSLANDAVDALTAVHGTRYGVGNSAIILYPAAGASDDYAKGVANIKYAYTVELRDTGAYGFELPPAQIIPTGEETFAGFQVVMNFVRDTYGAAK